jgi:hypothetical protein
MMDLTSAKKQNKTIDIHDSFTEFNMPFGVFAHLIKPTGIVFDTDINGHTFGFRYTISNEPSRLRPIRNWTILIENWEFRDDSADTKANDILFMRLKNRPSLDIHDGAEMVLDLKTYNKKIDINNKTTFNMIMALGLIISKIDSDQMPNISKILRTYNLQ